MFVSPYMLNVLIAIMMLITQSTVPSTSIPMLSIFIWTLIALNITRASIDITDNNNEPYNNKSAVFIKIILKSSQLYLSNICLVYSYNSLSLYMTYPAYLTLAIGVASYSLPVKRLNTLSLFLIILLLHIIL